MQLGARVSEDMGRRVQAVGRRMSAEVSRLADGTPLAEAPALLDRGVEAVQEGAHVARGLARALALRLHNAAVFPFVFKEPPGTVPASALNEIQERIVALLRADWRNVREGVYPAEVARGFSWRRLARAYPRMALDFPAMRRRVRDNAYEAVPASASAYPKYYRRNFHFQKDGYLGRDSAAMYDAQVEVLFAGLADAMRRQVLPPVVKAARALGRPARILDVACGTAPLLGMLARTLPDAALTGVDLSPHYVAEARRRLPDEANVSLLVENAEALPFVDAHFDVVTSVYLFHELPPDVRSKVLAEAARVLRPGGLLVVADSLQIVDAPSLAPVLDRFPLQFHEPFYRQYVRDDFEARFAAAGLEKVSREGFFLTGVHVWRKPAE